MNKVKCPECGEQHDVIEDCEYQVLHGTNIIVTIDGRLVVADNVIDRPNIELITYHGSLIYCHKEARHIALGVSKIESKIDKLSNDIIEF